LNPSKELALHKYVQEQMGGSYLRGKNDCATFAAGALDLLTGGSLQEKITGQWHDEKTALAYIKKNGSIGAHWEREGCKFIPTEYMTTGDFPVIRDTKTLLVGVCLGSKTAINTVDEGVAIFPNEILENIVGVWRAR
jgi:hypothetical protein